MMHFGEASKPGRRGDDFAVLHRHHVVVADFLVTSARPEVSSVNETMCGEHRLSFEQLHLRHSRERLGQSSQPRVQLPP